MRSCEHTHLPFSRIALRPALLVPAVATLAPSYQHREFVKHLLTSPPSHPPIERILSIHTIHRESMSH